MIIWTNHVKVMFTNEFLFRISCRFFNNRIYKSTVPVVVCSIYYITCIFYDLSVALLTLFQLFLYMSALCNIMADRKQSYNIAVGILECLIIPLNQAFPSVFGNNGIDVAMCLNV